ncbi:hypothetical protein KBD87_04885 [Candidatus Saccharibacteria bacterium]|nr:hypothetical protein [Candidatus Saccharibacteria bacterium]
MTPDEETPSDDSNVQANQPSFVLGKTAKAASSPLVNPPQNEEQHTDIGKWNVVVSLIVLASVAIGLKHYRHRRV